MPTQKIFKGRVRARMTKTGESYTAARLQLLRKAGDGSADGHVDPDPEPITAAEAAATDPAMAELMTSDDAMRRATGRGHEEWFAILDAWGATGHTHTEIAAWLKDVQGAPSWWNQNITVNYERIRGLRARHQMADGFSVSVTRTIAVTPERALAAFTDPALRERWLPDAGMTPRPTRSKVTARFDWPEPASRVVVTVAAKDPGRTIVAVSHEQIGDAATADAEKVAWRGRLDTLRTVLEGETRAP